MTGRYAVLAGRIRQDLAEIERIVDRIERGLRAREKKADDDDLLIDSVALNLHDFYTGLERIFMHIASSLDQTVPSGADWHRELLKQMTVEIPGLRPAVLNADLARQIDELLRFRHGVRHVYAFDLEPERIESLASRLGPDFHDVRAALMAHAAFLETMAQRA